MGDRRAIHPPLLAAATAAVAACVPQRSMWSAEDETHGDSDDEGANSARLGKGGLLESLGADALECFRSAGLSWEAVLLAFSRCTPPTAAWILPPARSLANCVAGVRSKAEGCIHSATAQVHRSWLA